jgi:hypothetical protein
MTLQGINGFILVVTFFMWWKIRGKGFFFAQGKERKGKERKGVAGGGRSEWEEVQ